MTSDLGLARNFSDLGLAGGCNHIYPGHVTAGITFFVIWLFSIGPRLLGFVFIVLHLPY